MTQHPTTPPLFSVFNEIGIIAQLSNTAFERVLADGMTVSQFSVLNHLVRLGDGKNPSSIANAFQVTRGAMTNTLGKLETRGCIDIRSDAEDGRGKKVFITAKGRRAREAGLAALGPQLSVLLSDFDEAEFEAALPFLQRLRSVLDAARD